MSKELEALEEIGNIDLGDNPYKTFDRNRLKNIYDKEFSSIKQGLIKAQEQEKVLKVILKKQVDINEIKIMISNLKHCDDIERCKRYNASRKVGYKLKQEEFNSIKEMLKNV